jgi:hypothetical protein
MSLTKTATKNHLIIGIVLIFLSISSLVIKLFFEMEFVEIAIFFFGVWGGVEIGRYLEYRIAKN